MQTNAVPVGITLLVLVVLANPVNAQVKNENPFDLVPAQTATIDLSANDGTEPEEVADTPEEDLVKGDADVVAVIPEDVAPKDIAPDNEPVAIDLDNRAAEIDLVLQQEYSKAVLIEIEGDIFGRFNWYLKNRLDWAQRQGADLVIVQLTTPGGSLQYSLELAEALQEITWAKTAIFIPKEAISGGAILSLGADRIYMVSDALFGDAGPIELRPGGQFEHAGEKILSYLSPAMRKLAKKSNRPEALALAMVDKELVVYEATDLQTQQIVYLTQDETEAEDAKLKFEIGQAVPETLEDRFLTVSADRAQELHLCDGVFETEQDFLGAFTISELERTQITWTDKLVYVLNHPVVTGLLLVVGLIGLYLELVAPGISVAGLTATFSFGIFFWSHFLGGTAGWLEVLLFGLGVLFVICEIFILPGFGVFGIAGIGLLVLSLVMASQNFVIPEDASQWSQLRTNAMIVLGSIFGVLVLFFGQLLLLDSLPGLSRFQLGAPAEPGPMTATSITSLTESSADDATNLQIGQSGIADSDLRPSGKVTIENQLVDVVTEGDYVEAGSDVEIVRVEGNRVVVRRKSR